MLRNSHVEFCAGEAKFCEGEAPRSAALSKFGKLAKPCSDLEMTLLVRLCFDFVDSWKASSKRAGKEVHLARMTYKAAEE